MSSYTVVNVSDLFEQVRAGCSRRDSRAVGAALRRLIRTSSGSTVLSVGYEQLFRLCLVHLQLDRIREIQKTFERLIAEWTRALITLETCSRALMFSDIRIESLEDDAVLLRTSDIAATKRLRAAHGARLGAIERLPSGETLWNYTVKRRSLPRVVEMLRTPQYVDFLNSNYTGQLSLEL